MKRFLLGFFLGVIGGVFGLGAVLLYEFSEEEKELRNEGVNRMTLGEMAATT